MNSKSFLALALLLSLALFSARAVASYVPHQGDYFSYYEVQNLGSGTGDYSGYTEQTIINGTETINGVTSNGTVSAYYSYSYDFSSSSGSTETGGSSGNFTFSSTNFLYINGTDDQTGYVNPTVWFCMDNSIPEGDTFTLLNTLMTVKSTNYSYFLTSQNRSVYAIYAQGKSNYQRNDVYGQFTATYTWNTYFDPSSGYIIGYDYTEHDTNPSGTGFTYTENLYVNSTSYQLTMAGANNPDWWPMFHHDLNRTGTSTSTGPTTNNTLWNYTTGNYVDSSPAVVGDLVYVGSDDDNVYCLNATTGALVWNYTTDYFVDSSPAVVGGLVYIGSADRNVYCLNADTGAKVWNYTTGDIVETCPAVVGGLVYIGSYDDNVYCLNATNGTQVWNCTTGHYVDSSPAVVGGLVYVGSSDGNVYCLNATTGALVWSCTTVGYVGYSSPAVVNGVVYVGTLRYIGGMLSDGNIYAFGPLPLTLSISPTSVTMDDGQSCLFTSTVSGGTSTYSYQWFLNGSAVLGATNATWTFTPTSVGSYTVYVNVTDSVGAQATSNTAAVTASPAIPEYRSALILPLFMMTTLLAAIVLKRKRNIRT